MRFSAEILDVSAFRNMMRAIICEEASLVLEENGLNLLMMDSSHVAEIVWRLDSKQLNHYDYEDGTRFTVNVPDLLKFLDSYSKDDPLKVTLDTVNNKLLLDGRASRTTEKGSTLGRSRKFSVPLLDYVDDEVPTPKIFFKAKAKLISHDLAEAMTDAGLVSEFVKVMIDSEKLTIDGVGDMGKAENSWERGADDLIELKMEEESKATYTLAMLKDVVERGARCGEAVTIELSEDMPIHLDFETAYGRLEYYVAPCIGVQ